MSRARIGLAGVAAATIAVIIAACGSKKSAAPLPAGCQPLLDGQDCLLPYPSDFFRVATTGTGRSVVVPPGIGPLTFGGEIAVPEGLQAYDGFSPGTPVVTVWPVAVATTGLVRVIDDPAPTAQASSPTVIVEVPTGRLV
ncbi:MAG TPA: hypothetical protein VMV18_10305, partial [bacterium]|nr:hypothetical protein [bacterium]